MSFRHMRLPKTSLHIPSTSPPRGRSSTAYSWLPLAFIFIYLLM
jgi:hypothetical protein